MTATIYHPPLKSVAVEPLALRIADHIADARHVAAHPQFYSAIIRRDAAGVLYHWGDGRADNGRAADLASLDAVKPAAPPPPAGLQRSDRPVLVMLLVLAVYFGTVAVALS